MNAPYRDDQVAKLQAENDKLRLDNDTLMYRFLALRKWPAVIAIILGSGGLVTSGVLLGNAFLPSISEIVSVQPISSQDRLKLGREIAKQVNTQISAQSRVPVSSRSCPACAPYASGRDDRVLGMNKVVSGTIGGWRTGPLSEDWKFSARAGDEVVFRMKKIIGNLDPILTLVGRAGNVLGSDDNSGTCLNATLRYHFASDGIYTLRCMRYEGEGSYTLSATRFTGAR